MFSVLFPSRAHICFLLNAHFSTLKNLIKLFGMPFVISPEEAEAQCVTLQRVDLVDLVASDDSDVWPFGARHVCRHLFGTVNESRSKVGKGHKSKLHSPSCYCLEDVRASLGRLNLCISCVYANDAFVLHAVVGCSLACFGRSIGSEKRMICREYSSLKFHV